MTTISQALSAALLHFLWQGIAVAFVMWAVLSVVPNGMARARYLIACAAMALMAAMPAITFAMWYRAPVVLFGTAAVTGGNAARAAANSWSGEWLAMVKAWAVPVWAAGVLLFTMRLVMSYRHIARLRVSGTEAESAVLDVVRRLAERMGVTGPVGVLISTMADSPSVVS